MEEVQSGFLDDSDYLQRALVVFMFKPSIRFQVVTLEILESLKGDIQSMVILYALNGRTSDSLGKTAHDLAAADKRLRSHVVALTEKLDSIVQMDKLPP